MRLHLATISDLGYKYLDTKYKPPSKRLSVEDIVKKKNHNIMMIDIASTLSYDEFDEIDLVGAIESFIESHKPSASEWYQSQILARSGVCQT
ncbi:hypothetical protein [Enterobacter hormaechei]|uniref:hypothetical protein n=1 Tax=Enterobacter hormaechei TaxID=158836 RepID=UPI0023E3A595|nr:hypothetical protein [Enterobacter hormaechei]MDF3686193.1 hypothetical protein [Enterobacter hormaechei]